MAAHSVVVRHRSVGITVGSSVSDVITERTRPHTLTFGFGIFVGIGCGEMGSGEEPTCTIFASHFYVPLSFSLHIYYTTFLLESQ